MLNRHFIKFTYSNTISDGSKTGKKQKKIEVGERGDQDAQCASISEQPYQYYKHKNTIIFLKSDNHDDRSIADIILKIHFFFVLYHCIGIKLYTFKLPSRIWVMNKMLNGAFNEMFNNNTIGYETGKNTGGCGVDQYTQGDISRIVDIDFNLL